MLEGEECEDSFPLEGDLINDGACGCCEPDVCGDYVRKCIGGGDGNSRNSLCTLHVY